MVDAVGLNALWAITNPPMNPDAGLGSADLITKLVGSDKHLFPFSPQSSVWWAPLPTEQPHLRMDNHRRCNSNLCPHHAAVSKNRFLSVLSQHHFTFLSSSFCTFLPRPDLALFSVAVEDPHLVAPIRRDKRSAEHCEGGPCPGLNLSDAVFSAGVTVGTNHR